MQQPATNENILEICREINKKTLELVPTSSNQTDKFYGSMNLLIRAVRRRQDEVRDMILKWYIPRDVSMDRLLNLPPLIKDVSFKREKRGKFKGEFFGPHNTPPSLRNLYSYLNTLPRKENKEVHKDGSPVYTIELIESLAKTSIRGGIGNCQEKSAIAFCLLLEYECEAEIYIPIEWVGISNNNGGDHQFIIVNRDWDTSLDDVSSWNSDAIILDPWWETCFQVGDKLNDEELDCKKYIAYYQEDIIQEAISQVGAGHSKRWENHRAQKNEPINLGEFTPPEKESIPWKTFNK